MPWTSQNVPKQLWHLADQLKDRYGLSLDQSLYEQLLAIIQRGLPPSSFPSTSPKCKVFDVPFRGQFIRLVYQKRLDALHPPRIVTALPPGAFSAPTHPVAPQVHVLSASPLKIKANPAANAGLPDFTGTKFGRLEVTGYWANGHGRWVVKCACGNYEVRTTKAVRAADTAARCSSCRKVDKSSMGNRPSRSELYRSE